MLPAVPGQRKHENVQLQYFLGVFECTTHWFMFLFIQTPKKLLKRDQNQQNRKKLGFCSIDKIIRSQLMRDIAVAVFGLSVLRSSTTAGNNHF